MANIINNHELLVYVIDADTKQLIRRNFKYNRYQDAFGEDFTYYDLIPGGTNHFDVGGISSASVPMSFDFDESQITELGYDYSSITGNVIEAVFDPELDAYLMPSVSIIYMSKLK